MDCLSQEIDMVMASWKKQGKPGLRNTRKVN